jgi:hypothetical protein
LLEQVAGDEGSDMRRYLLAALVTFTGGALAHAQTPDQQERCAMKVKQLFWQSWGEYHGHYSNKTGKCFALLVNKITDFGSIIDEILLVDIIDDPDPVEVRRYAVYVQTTIPEHPDFIHCDLIPIPGLRPTERRRARD